MAKLSQAQRAALPRSAFAIPENAPGPDSFPIPDRKHAVIAIKDATGTQYESRVRAAVKRKFGIG